MKTNGRQMRTRFMAAFTCTVIGILLVGACTAVAPGEGEKANDSSSGGRSGAELWAERCSQCHNMRSPGSLSDAQWYAAMAHMRIRAYLTGDEERKIRTFLQAGN